MGKLDCVFQTDSEIIKDVYRNNVNFLIENTGNVVNGSNYCILYFSSHDIYYPNNEETFREQILKKDRYEWYNTRIDKGVKHIFIRDIQKQWYLKGINDEINSVEKLYEFLKKETAGYKVITVGSSAGGFAAVLFGSMLNSAAVFSFNGQFFLNNLLHTSSEKIDPVIFREKDNPDINKYFSLRQFINGSGVFYFYSDRSLWDIEQYNHISDLSLHVIPFRTSHHGIPFLKSNLKYVINYPIPELQKLSNKLQHPFLFSVKIEGLLGTVSSLTKQTQKYIARKLKQ